jgi:hypothetical protein
MFTLSFGKIVIVVLAILAAWKGVRLLGALQRKLEATQRPAAPPPRPTAAAEPTDLVACPRCGTYVPNGTWCPSVEECRLRKA